MYIASGHKIAMYVKWVQIGAVIQGFKICYLIVPVNNTLVCHICFVLIRQLCHDRIGTGFYKIIIIIMSRK